MSKKTFDPVARKISPPPNKKQKTAPSTSSSAALTSFFTPLTQKKASATRIDWQVRNGTLLVAKCRAADIKPHPRKIAAFDLVCAFEMPLIVYRMEL